MPLTLAVDILLVLVLIAYAAYGYRSGLIRSLGGIAGIVAGGFVAFLAVPLVSGAIPSPQWRGPATLAIAIVLLIGGHAVGAGIGHAIARTFKAKPLRVIDRVLGAAVSFLVCALVVSLVAGSVTALGIPAISAAVASSHIVRTIDSITPNPVKAVLAQVRSFAVQEGLPLIGDAFAPPQAPEIPEIATGTPELRKAAQSVVRITGTAFACGQSQTGSGFVIAPERVITNAHVLAGVQHPVVEAPGVGGLTGRIVYFDPRDDLAVIAVDGLPTAPLEFGPNLASGDTGVIDGYPFGGPFDSVPAEVLTVGTILSPDIYGEDPAPREVYSLATNIEQGNSGGPLLTEAGVLAGVVFGKAANTENVGYALTMTELAPVIAQAETLEATAPSGRCVAG